MSRDHAIILKAAGLGALLAILATLGVMYALLQDRRQDLLLSCERDRMDWSSGVSLREDLVEVNEGRVQADDPGPEKEANRFALKAYREDLREHLATEPKPCDQVYPPLNPFSD